MQSCAAVQHSQVERHALSPGPQRRGSQEPRTQDSQSPHVIGHSLGSHAKSPATRSAQVNPASHAPGHSPPQPSGSPQSLPTHDGMQTQVRGSPVHTSPARAHRVPGTHVPPQPSLGTSPQARVDAAVQLGRQQLPATQRSPRGHIAPSLHVRQIRPSAARTGGIGVPHETLAVSGQNGQHSRSA